MVKPVYKIEVNGADKTLSLQDKISSITFTDKDGTASDDIRLLVAGDYKRPSYKDEIKLWIGYEDQELFYCGIFLVQSTTKDRYSLTIKATGADFSETLKQKRDMAYEKVSLASIAETVAARHSLKVKTDFNDTYVTHISQSNESDLHFMDRLADDNDGLFSIKNGTLIFRKRSAANMDKLPVFNISAAETTKTSITHLNKTLYRSCTARWQDTKENKIKEVTAGSGTPVLEIDGQFKNEAEALKRAESKLAKAQRGLKEGKISSHGFPVRAGAKLNITNAGEDNGEYLIESIVHKIDKKWTIELKIKN